MHLRRASADFTGAALLPRVFELPESHRVPSTPTLSHRLYIARLLFHTLCAKQLFSPPWPKAEIFGIRDRLAQVKGFLAVSARRWVLNHFLRGWDIWHRLRTVVQVVPAEIVKPRVCHNVTSSLPQVAEAYLRLLFEQTGDESC